MENLGLNKYILCLKCVFIYETWMDLDHEE